jgi:hypothetical protein
MTGSRATGPSARIGLLAVFALACVMAKSSGVRPQGLGFPAEGRKGPGGPPPSSPYPHQRRQMAVGMRQ